MKTTAVSPSKKTSAYALMITVILTAVTLLVLAATLRLTSGECRLTGRHNLYTSALAAAEGGTERVMAQLERDFQNQSVSSNLSTYSSLLPDQTTWPTKYQFSDGSGNVNKTRVTSNGTTVAPNQPVWATLNSSFKGLYGMVTPYQVSSRAMALNQSESVAATVTQDFQLALIPVFQFAIFYNMDLEINPGADMDITGKVHSNAKLYSAPGAKLRYLSDVTFSDQYYQARHPDDPSQGSGQPPSFIGDPTGPKQASSMVLPVGTNNSPTAITAILDPPPFAEDPNEPMAKLRFYNNADVIITNTSSGAVTVRSGKWNNFATVEPDNADGTYSFINKVSYYDYREMKTVQATELDVSKFKTWVANTTSTGGSSLNSAAKFNLNHALNSVYVLDNRANTTTTLTAVRVSNGGSLPNDGLTVATPQPLYVKGDYNLGNTSQTKPSALIGDSINILSGSWEDGNTSKTSLGDRRASDTTVNAALLAGIVTTKKVSNSAHYSGGVENFPRFLENWSGKTLTYNGSMVVMFPSRYATNFWVETGNYYNPPKRQWAFDVNFLTQKGMPPMTPCVKKLVRGTWASK